tara:strand:- start:1121 stop:1546 length:426 start_codon:yes stop_codon:yes gene_type:complete
MYLSYPPESFANSAFPSRAIVRSRARATRGRRLARAAPLAPIVDDDDAVDGDDDDGPSHRLDVAHDEGIARIDIIARVISAPLSPSSSSRSSSSSPVPRFDSIIRFFQSSIHSFVRSFVDPIDRARYFSTCGVPRSRVTLC